MAQDIIEKIIHIEVVDPKTIRGATPEDRVALRGLDGMTVQQVLASGYRLRAVGEVEHRGRVVSVDGKEMNEKGAQYTFRLVGDALEFE